MNAFTVVSPAMDYKGEQCRNKHAVKLLDNNCAAAILEQIGQAMQKKVQILNKLIQKSKQIANEDQLIEDEVDSLT